MVKSKRRLAYGLGAKFGSSVRKRFVAVSQVLRAKRMCPHCGSQRFKRKAAGIWVCSKCGISISGEAYDIKLR